MNEENRANFAAGGTINLRTYTITYSVKTRTNTRWPVMWCYTRQWVMWRYLAWASPPPLLHSTCIYFYSCCSLLKRKASVKRFVSLQFLNPRQSIGRTGREISRSQGRYLHRTTQAENKRRQTSIHWVGFEPTVRMFERAKEFHRPRGHCVGRASTLVY
jgi:hypothetical protein